MKTKIKKHPNGEIAFIRTGWDDGYWSEYYYNDQGEEMAYTTTGSFVVNGSEATEQEYKDFVSKLYQEQPKAIRAVLSHDKPVNHLGKHYTQINILDGSEKHPVANVSGRKLIETNELTMLFCASPLLYEFYQMTMDHLRDSCDLSKKGKLVDKSTEIEKLLDND